MYELEARTSQVFTNARTSGGIVVLAVYLLTPEPVMAPTLDRAGDAKKMGDAKAMKGNVLLSVSGAGLATKIVSGSKSTPAKEKAVEKVTEKAVEKGKSESNGKSDRTLKDPLRRDKNGEPKADPEAKGTSHTQLGTKQGRKGEYKQGREFDKDGKAVKDIDHTDHGRPGNHPNPHEHRYEPSSTGGTPRRGGTEPLK